MTEINGQKIDKGSSAQHTLAEPRIAENVHGESDSHFTLDTLYSIIEDRRMNKKPGSYTTYLFDKGLDKMLKKLGEESTEVIIAGKSGSKADTIYEIADLVYHAMVLMSQMGITLDDILSELATRYNTKERSGR